MSQNPSADRLAQIPSKSGEAVPAPDPLSELLRKLLQHEIGLQESFDQGDDRLAARRALKNRLWQISVSKMGYRGLVDVAEKKLSSSKLKELDPGAHELFSYNKGLLESRTTKPDDALAAQNVLREFALAMSVPENCGSLLEEVMRGRRSPAELRTASEVVYGLWIRHKQARPNQPITPWRLVLKEMRVAKMRVNESELREYLARGGMGDWHHDQAPERRALHSLEVRLARLSRNREFMSQLCCALWKRWPEVAEQLRLPKSKGRQKSARRGGAVANEKRHKRINELWESKAFRTYKSCARKLGEDYTEAEVRRAVNRRAKRKAAGLE